jgi:uncharacterized protein with HEPN domain
MHPKSPKLLDDVLRSCQFISDDAAGVTLDAYLHDRRTRQVVERNLGIIGEALFRLRDIDTETAEQITDLPQIIGLRNRLAHGYYEDIDDALVWRAVQESLPILRSDVEKLMPEFE